MKLKKYYQILLVLLAFIMSSTRYNAQKHESKITDTSLFVTEWDLSIKARNGYEDYSSISFYLNTTGDVNYTWISSDNTTGSGTISDGTKKVTLDNFPVGQKIIFSLETKNVTRFFNYYVGGYLGNNYDNRLIDIKQWGNINWNSFAYAFYNCVNLDISATDFPNLSNITNMERAFYQCSSLTNPQNINMWDTSKVTNMSYIFYKASKFNGNVSTWKTPNLTNMTGMFYEANLFNQNIASWDTSKVTNMSYLFYKAFSFNGNISNWNTTNVTDMYRLLYRAKSFNQDISKWNTSKVTNMAYMLYDVNTFNYDISNWDTSNVENMSYMLYNASTFNQDISKWTYKPDVKLDYMISGSNLDCANYSAILYKWANDISLYNPQKINANNLLYSSNIAIARQRLIENGWTIYGDKSISCESKNDLFITEWDLTKTGSPVVNGLTSISFYADLSEDTEYIVRSGDIFYQSNKLFQNDKKFVISGIPANLKVTLSINSNHINSFYTSDKSTLTPNIDSKRLVDVKQWGTSTWTDMTAAFAGCTNLNITAKDTPNLTRVNSTSAMFYNNTNLEGPANIDQWLTHNITDMSKMFMNATKFNRPINNWTTSHVNTMSEMFYNATAFNQNLSNWDINSNINLTNTLSLSGLDCYNYLNLLTSWANNPNTPNNITLGATGLIYNTNNKEAREKLIAKNWTITGDIESNTNCISYFITEWDLSKKGYTSYDTTDTTSISFNLLSGDHVNYKWKTTDGIESGNGTIEVGIYRPYQALIKNLPKNKTIILSLDSKFLRHFQVDDYHKERLTDVKQWGATKWLTMEWAFFEAKNLNISATDIPDLSQVTSMARMFEATPSINSPRNIGKWDTSNVSDMGRLFYDAVKFNQNISEWNTANVTNMKHMFSGASSFNQNLGAWQINPDVDMEFMLNHSNLDCTNYSATLQAWAENPNTPDNRNFGANGRTYGTDAVAARNKLRSKGWSINEDIAGTTNCNSSLDINNPIITRSKTILYPNPVGEQISLQTSENILAVEIYNFEGEKIINTIPSKDNKLDVSHLKAGVYILKVYTQHQVESLKFIKN